MLAKNAQLAKKLRDGVRNAAYLHKRRGHLSCAAITRSNIHSYHFDLGGILLKPSRSAQIGLVQTSRTRR